MSFPLFSFANLSFNDVRRCINNLKNKNLSDLCGISSVIVKLTKNIVLVPVTRPMNQSINFGVYPDALKILKVVRIHKGVWINLGQLDWINKFWITSKAVTFSTTHHTSIEKIYY